MLKKYSQISGFHYVSSHTGRGIKCLYEDILKVTQEQKYMGESSPISWMKLETQLREKRETSPLLTWAEVEGIGETTGILDDEV